jgi:biotin carboxyl carrier protein
MKYITKVNDQEFIIEIDQEGQVSVDGRPYAVDFQQLSEGGILSLLLNNHSLEAIVEERENGWEVLIRGELYSVDVQDERAYRLARARGTVAEITGEATIESPMPGLIIDVLVEPNQVVQKDGK